MSHAVPVRIIYGTLHIFSGENKQWLLDFWYTFLFFIIQLSSGLTVDITINITGQATSSNTDRIKYRLHLYIEGLWFDWVAVFFKGIKIGPDSLGFPVMC